MPGKQATDEQLCQLADLLSSLSEIERTRLFEVVECEDLMMCGIEDSDSSWFEGKVSEIASHKVLETLYNTSDDKETLSERKEVSVNPYSKDEAIIRALNKYLQPKRVLLPNGQEQTVMVVGMLEIPTRHASRAVRAAARDYLLQYLWVVVDLLASSDKEERQFYSWIFEDFNRSRGTCRTSEGGWERLADSDFGLARLDWLLKHFHIIEESLEGKMH